MVTSAAVEPVASAAPAWSWRAPRRLAAWPRIQTIIQVTMPTATRPITVSSCSCSRCGSCSEANRRAAAAPMHSTIAASTPIHTPFMASRRFSCSRNAAMMPTMREASRPSRRPMTNVGSMAHLSESKGEATLTKGRRQARTARRQRRERRTDVRYADRRWHPRPGRRSCMPISTPSTRRSSSCSTRRCEGRRSPSAAAWCWRRRTRRRRSACTARCRVGGRASCARTWCSSTGTSRSTSVSATRSMEVLRDFTPWVERVSIDEAFLDVSGSTHLFGTPTEIAAEIRRRVRDEIGLPISVGVATTKHLAKVASQVAKPERPRGGGTRRGTRVPRPVAGRVVVGHRPGHHEAPGRRGHPHRRRAARRVTGARATPARSRGRREARRPGRQRGPARDRNGAERAVGRRAVGPRAQGRHRAVAAGDARVPGRSRCHAGCARAATRDARSRCGCASATCAPSRARAPCPRRSRRRARCGRCAWSW